MLPQSLFYDGTYFTSAAFALAMPAAVLYTSFINALFSVLPRQRRNEVDFFQIPPRDTKLPLPIAIVTGSNTGIGFELSFNLITRGYNVIVACRSPEKGEAAAKAINYRATKLNEKDHQIGKALFLHPCDLSSFSSIQSFVDEFHKSPLYHGSLNLLVNNAGINSNGVSTDGLDLCFQSNFLGHYLLTRLLLSDLMNARNYLTYPNEAESGRIVNLSSVMHHFASPLPNSKNEWKSQCIEIGSTKYPVKRNTYSHSKLAAILFTMELNKQFCDANIRAFSVNPGAVNSDIWRDVNPILFKYIVGPVFRLLYLTPAEGALTVLAAATGNFPNNQSYLQPYWLPRLSLLSAYESCQTCYYKCPFPVFEMLGPYIGHAATEPRLPQKDGGMQSASSLWIACEEALSARMVNLRSAEPVK